MLADAALADASSAERAHRSAIAVRADRDGLRTVDLLSSASIPRAAVPELFTSDRTACTAGYSPHHALPQLFYFKMATFEISKAAAAVAAGLFLTSVASSFRSKVSPVVGIATLLFCMCMGAGLVGMATSWGRQEVQYGALGAALAFAHLSNEDAAVSLAGTGAAVCALAFEVLSASIGTDSALKLPMLQRAALSFALGAMLLQKGGCHVCAARSLFPNAHARSRSTQT